MSNNAHELSNRLLNALDNNYNVVDMHTVNEIISILERFNITKELLETTRLGKHVNELRRKTSDPQLARRAKVLVKRWRDLVIPTVSSPGHNALPGSNRSSAERQVRRLGGTPLTSPALSRQVVSPAVPSPRPQSRPAWGGYESDSQDVILVDDDPPLPPTPLTAHKQLTTPVKRPPSPQPLYDEKKAKRDKKPKKRRGHSRAGSGTEATSPLPNMGGITIPAPEPAPQPAPLPAPLPVMLAAPLAAPLPATNPWRDRNGTGRRRNGKKNKLDPYTVMVNRMPTAGAKKVKTTQELLEDIQSRGVKPPASPASPGSPDVMLIEDSCPMKVESPLRNGGPSPPPPLSPPRAATPLPPLEDPREYHECRCEADAPEAQCPAARRARVLPLHVHGLHHAHLPGVNGTRAPLHPHQFAVRPLTDPDRPDLFASVVPLYKYSDYADDRCVKNMSRVPLCLHLPWTEFAPSPPSPPPPGSPPPIRPYPIDDIVDKIKLEADESKDSEATNCSFEEINIEAEMVSIPTLEPSERLKAPILSVDEESQFRVGETPVAMEVEEAFETEHQDHRTVERTKEHLDGQLLHDMVQRTKDSIPYDYSQMSLAPVVTLPEDVEEADAALRLALEEGEGAEREALGRPPRAERFAEWHECARLGDLVALPYVVID